SAAPSRCEAPQSSPPVRPRVTRWLRRTGRPTPARRRPVRPSAPGLPAPTRSAVQDLVFDPAWSWFGACWRRLAGHGGGSVVRKRLRLVAVLGGGVLRAGGRGGARNRQALGLLLAQQVERGHARVEDEGRSATEDLLQRLELLKVDRELFVLGEAGHDLAGALAPLGDDLPGRGIGERLDELCLRLGALAKRLALLVPAAA